ncbi:collagen alpha-1(I) chain-like [Anneissia japonica]|uniref:collagen alpha-1(I) chain-like n=1 Tax=Anneissia japonica TaxID=1529436 RepID=UPI0014256CF8|nr:collagen alpha-1(I) chain-like [Anneissia japonica]XP_033119470.1 collagen alpha-1(I) chain-like [Anneissia japonica]XP_033119471.1 collagen alpha-1(I) chain-like [Anneissia japonica]XP_033119472.1 collagen alpha-1(I) chain-like [Anneissia japonica]XP_033119473.1 collagen alpha-1(I) chain-like [Anneissia japonica]XP_033119475.1 collagen alpha-1(I) chain-like [Anneissia japonica]
MGGVSLQSIFNVTVGAGLLLLCSSGILKFQQIDNKLEGHPTLGHEINKRDTSLTTAPDKSTSCTMQCPRGPPGPEGAKAIPGVPGVPGVPGTNGEPGCKGDTGPAGVIGVPGEPGAPGETGLTGRTGRSGHPGKAGATGEQGVQGPPGPPGPEAEPVQEPIFTSCNSLKKAGVDFNGVYTIDPDGPDAGLDPFSVVCDMTSDLTIGYTTIQHDKEEDGNVNNAETQGSFRVDITYDHTSEQIAAIKNVSTSCRQFIKYQCIGSLFDGGYHYWVSVDGDQMFNWGGVPTGTTGCACWITKTCDDVTKRCNCDVNDAVPRQDLGYLTDKATLPVSQLRFGDTGDTAEKGVYTLGPLQCA